MCTVDRKQKAGQSSQIDFYPHDTTARDDAKVVEMHHGWNRRQVSEVRFRDTYKTLFGERKTFVWTEGRANFLAYVYSF